MQKGWNGSNVSRPRVLAYRSRRSYRIWRACRFLYVFFLITFFTNISLGYFFALFRLFSCVVMYGSRCCCRRMRNVVERIESILETERSLTLVAFMCCVWNEKLPHTRDGEQSKVELHAHVTRVAPTRTPRESFTRRPASSFIFFLELWFSCCFLKRFRIIMHDNYYYCYCYYPF